MRKLFAVLLFIFHISLVFGFEGNIQLIRYSQYDTTYFVFYVKDSKVRLDEFDSRGKLNKTLLVNLVTEKVVALSPSQKLYADITRKMSAAKVNPGVEVIKTSNFKFIEGKKCFQWRVRNRILNSEVTYWVMASETLVMEKLYHVLNLTDNYSTIASYFQHIPQNTGFIPLLAVERNLLREQKQSLQVTSITEKKMAGKFFEIPVNYKSLRI